MSHRKNMRLIMLFILLIVTLTLALPYVRAETTYPWPMFHYNPAHTGYTQSPAPATFVLGWKYQTDGGVLSSPAIVDGKVYIGSQDKYVYCLDANAGTLVWKYATAGIISFSSPAVVGDEVYIGSEDYNIYCLNAKTGTLVWKYATAGIISSSPTIVDGKVYVLSNDKYVYCINATSGSLIWKYGTEALYIDTSPPTFPYANSSPAVVDGKVYVGSDDGHIYCLDAASGSLIWKYGTGSFVSSSPTVVDGKVYVGSHNYIVYCLDAASGSLIWKYSGIGYVWNSSPAVAGGKLYVSIRTGFVCLDAATGTEAWYFNTYGMTKSSPAVADGKVYIGSQDKYVYCLNATTGSFLHRYLTNLNVDSSPAVADNKIYIGGEDGFVYCFVGEGTVPKVSTTISCVVSPTSVLTGNSLTVSGSITPAVSGAIVTLTYTRPDATTLTTKFTSGADGSFTATYTPDQVGNWAVKSSWLGDATHEGATSSVTAFTITAPAAGIPMEYVYAGVGIVAIAVVAVAAYLYMKRGKK